MNKKPELKLIKSESFEEPEIFTRSFSYGIVLDGTFSLDGENEEEVNRLASIGKSIVSDPEFKKELLGCLYQLLADKLGEEV